jgi:WD40 repeat protein
LSRDGKSYVALSDAGVEVRDVSSARPVRTLSKSKYTTISATADGKLVAALFFDIPTSIPATPGAAPPVLAPGYLDVLESGTGKKLWSWKPAKGSANRVAFAPDGKRLVLVGDDGVVRFFDARSGEERQRIDTGGAKLYHLALTGDGTRLAVVDSGGEAGGPAAVRVWEGTRELFRLEAPESRLGRFFVSLAFTADGKSLVTGGSTDRLVEWDLATGKERRRFGSQMEFTSSLAISPDGNTVAAINLTPKVRLIDRATGADVAPGTGHTRALSGAALSSDGRTAMTTAWPDLFIWDVATGRVKQRLEAGATESLDLAYDGRSAFANDVETKVFRVLDLPSGKERFRLAPKAEPRFLYQFRFSPDGSLLAVSTEAADTIRLLDARTGKALRSLREPGQEVNSLEFTADGRTLFIFYADQKARVWDAATGTKLRQFGPLPGGGGRRGTSPRGGEVPRDRVAGRFGGRLRQHRPLPLAGRRGHRGGDLAVRQGSGIQGRFVQRRRVRIQPGRPDAGGLSIGAVSDAAGPVRVSNRGG